MLSRPEDDRKRDGKRARDRHRYQRQIAGLAVAPVEYSREIVDYLIRWHWLDSAQDKDPRCIGDAISRAMQESAEADQK